MVSGDAIGLAITIRGTVQGVGFRPFVYRLARRLGIAGTVNNTGEGILIQVQAPDEQIKAFVSALRNEAPPLTRISSLQQAPLGVNQTWRKFSILTSTASGAPQTLVPPDMALCADCRRELLDSTNRRYAYPFINCTNCGPRFSIIETTPYDRLGTSMRCFPLCGECQDEYDDPDDRRFHAQPNACPACGPSLSWHDTISSATALWEKTGVTGRKTVTSPPPPAAATTIVAVVDEDEKKKELAATAVATALSATATALAADRVVALRGLGGFHLAVNAASAEAVARLRHRKKRPSKPLAVMAGNLADLRVICELDRESEELLQGPQRPVVLVPKKAGTGDELAPNLAPGVAELGVMLPYTPLHELLFQMPNCPRVLVMTSGNRSGDPICASNKEAHQRLSEIADGFLLHNREIVNRIDDSVVRVMAGRPRLIRRARGYVPEPVDLLWNLPPLLACGGDLKSTFCLADARAAHLSRHLGDLNRLEVLEFYRESVDHQQRLLGITPKLAVCDIHPDFMSSHYGRQLGLPLYRVQHHHAHLVAVMAEHGLDCQVLGVVLDGAGYGEDGTIWGGEIMLADPIDYQRLASFELLPLPGADAAATAPWRMGLAALSHAFGLKGVDVDSVLVPALQQIDKRSRRVVTTMIDQSLNTPLTSSCGRLFDAVAALLGVRLQAEYEGQAAMELEALAQQAQIEHPQHIIPRLPVVLRYAHSHNHKHDHMHEHVHEHARARGHDHIGVHIHRYAHRHDLAILRIGLTEMIRALSAQISDGTSPGLLALAFHQWLIVSLTRALIAVVPKNQEQIVLLSGGCLQNRLLLEGLSTALERENFKVYSGQRIPVNDGGISLGQAVIGGLRHVSGRADAGY